MVNCYNCGDELERTNYQLKQSERYFCGPNCQGEWRSENRTGEDNWAWKGGKVTISCKQCNESFKVIPALEDKRQFCSKDCKNEWQSENICGENHHNYKRVELTCKNCGEIFKIKPYLSEDRKFCSTECRDKWQSENIDFSGDNNPMWNGGKIEVECEVCGDIVKVDPSKAKDRRFCSRKCMAESRKGENSFFWRGGHKRYYGPNWKEQRRKTLERDDYTCQRCGKHNAKYMIEKGKELTVHHKIPVSEFKKKENVNYDKMNDLDNLITLCKKCHMKIEWNGDD